MYLLRNLHWLISLFIPVLLFWETDTYSVCLCYSLTVLLTRWLRVLTSTDNAVVEGVLPAALL